ncbi:MAG: AbrB/MazE/SpoVT family DNA-binding domain-containing protein [Candidatus Diapherotrites archaeon]
MVLNEIRTSTITSKGQIVIPSDMRSRDGFKSGQKVTIFAFDDKIEIWPIEYIRNSPEFQAEVEKTREIARAFIKKHKLDKKKFKELTKKDKRELAKKFLK